MTCPGLCASLRTPLASDVVVDRLEVVRVDRVRDVVVGSLVVSDLAIDDTDGSVTRSVGDEHTAVAEDYYSRFGSVYQREVAVEGRDVWRRHVLLLARLLLGVRLAHAAPWVGFDGRVSYVYILYNL